MRLSLKLKSISTVLQRDFHSRYFTDFHGFVYQTMKTEKALFSFSNLFPVKGQKVVQDEYYNVLISSSIPSVIEKIFFGLKIGEKINIGELSFLLEEVKLVTRQLKNDSVIESINVINLTKHTENRIRAIKYDQEGYKGFLKQSLIRKYNRITGNSVSEDFDLFSNVDISLHEKHPTASFPINFYNKGKNKSFNVIGNKLVFTFKGISDEQLKIFQVCYDAGFGERCSYGAGFMVERF